MGQQKSRIKSQKHGVSFAEAETVFGELSAKMFYDDEHSDNEIREIWDHKTYYRKKCN
jgi:uncharacterized DUF497 family protein